MKTEQNNPVGSSGSTERIAGIDYQIPNDKTEQIKDWEEKLWGLLYDEYRDVGQNGNIKAFIASLLEEQKQEMVESLKKEKIQMLDRMNHWGGLSEQNVVGYNLAIDTVLSIINKEK